ncbi:MAG: hypothetical protein M0C28_35015 [Candidatus Moduliflexus flocculans]|nr:hypothetical protein [Candidatus Moduliflexus flocculans]
MAPKLILVTGATGYVGGRLVPRLLEAGPSCARLVRDPPRLHGTSLAGQGRSRHGRRACRRRPDRSPEGRFGRLLPHPWQAGRQGQRRTRPDRRPQLCERRQ